MSRRRAIVVLGMHRSGTSAVTRMISLLGADLPGELMPPVPGNNERGFWESRPIADLNDEMLDSAGSSWFDVVPMAPSWFDSPVAADFEDRAAELLASEFGESPFFVFKDPRLSVLLPLWQRVFDRAGVEASYVLTLRNPLEVAGSLGARDDLITARSALLWLRYQLAAERHSRSYRRLVVPYESMLEDWRPWAAEIGGRLDIAWPDESHAAVNAIDRFLSRDLRHQRFEASELESRPEIVDWVRRVYRTLRDKAPAVDGVEAALDRVAVEFAAGNSIYGPLLAEGLEDKERATRLSAQLTSVQSEAREIQEALAARQAEVAERDQTIAGLSAELEETTGRLGEQLATAAQRLVELEGDLETLTAEHAALEAERQEREARLRTLEQAGAEARSSFERSQADLRTQLDAALHRAAEHEKEAVTLRRRIDELETSTSWRLTAPIRTIGDRAPLVKRVLKPFVTLATLLWWTVTFRLHRRLPEYWRWRRSQKAGAQPTPAAPLQAVAAMQQPRAATMANEIQKYTNPGPGFEDPDPTIVLGQPRRARVIAFYLPQFHAIPENDEFWGAGFTEWRNLARGAPRFVGHYQPRTPRDLGFYDLSDPSTLRQQVEMAQNAGLGGFCFYYYMFDHGRLLDRPVETFLDHPELDFPFCLIWANENWTRTWDGHEQDVLLPQTYQEGWQHLLADDVARHMADRRYIKIDGRPFFAVYRPGLIPDATRQLHDLRARLAESVGVEPLIFMVQGFGDVDPNAFGLDGAVEFPPHKLGEGLRELRGTRQLLDPDFEGHVWSYDELVAAADRVQQPDFTLVRTVIPSWDNDPRRPGRGLVIADATPEKYEGWLRRSIAFAGRHPVGSERIVFVNAWNEWAEGAYLEPDVHYGSAYLNATARAVVDHQPAAKRRVLLVGHDAYKHGAQMLLLNLGSTLKTRFGVEVGYLLLEGGDLVDDYRRIGEVVIAPPGSPQFVQHIATTAGDGVTLALTNTTPGGIAAATLKDHGFRVVSLVHELPGIIREKGFADGATAIATHSDHIVFAAEMVRDGFAGVAPLEAAKTVIRPQGMYKTVATTQSDPADLHSRLGISSGQPIVLGVGYGDLRKGFDYFVGAAREAHRQGSDLQFLWLGKVETGLAQWLLPDTPPNFHHVDFTDDVGLFYGGSDVMFLSSREDPYPSTVLEALAAGIPIVGLEGCTGTEGVIDRFGALAEAGDPAAAVTVLQSVIDADTESRREERRRHAIEEYDFGDYAFALLQLLDPQLKKVSVVVPNYNYAHHLPERMASIFSQSYPVYEVLVLDDASTDDSLEVLQTIRESTGREFSLAVNPTNSGSIMGQWLAGAKSVRGELVWIAEADDSAKPAFLESLVDAYAATNPAFVFSDSIQVDPRGEQLADSYTYYFDRVDPERFHDDFSVSGREFARRYLGVKNLVLNVSGVLFDRDRLLRVLERDLSELAAYKFAGDWRVYAALCELGDVAFVAKSLNVHRRHDNSATFRAGLNAHLEELTRIHEFVASLVGSDDDLAEHQATYLDELRVQLGGDG